MKRNEKRHNDTSLPSVVIVGAGFAGLRVAQALRHSPCRVTVIDRSNHHLFQPLLYQVATATLSPADIAAPIRGVLNDQKNTEVIMSEVSGIDRVTREVLIDGGRVGFDYLVLATGSRHSYFGKDAWEKFAPGLKSIPDAQRIRQKILLAFEAAEMETDPVQRHELLNFVLVGGGPTGVEMAGAIAELAHRALESDFKRIDPRDARIILIEAGPRLLATFPESLSIRAQRDLERLGVQVRTNTRVEEVTQDGVSLGAEFIRSHTVIWTAGVVASPAGAWLGASVDRAQRVLVNPDLSVPEEPNIFVVGDTACTLGENGRPLPGVAPVAMQQGKYVGKLLARRLEGQKESPPFHYFDKGSLATIGRTSAVADVGKVKLTGLIAWITWLAVHIFYLIGFRNRLLVLIQWAWSYLTFQRGARLILPSEDPMPDEPSELRRTREKAVSSQ